MGKRARPKFARAYIDPVTDRAEIPQRSMEKLAIELPRLAELMDFYEVPPARIDNDPLPWMLLALRLAEDCEPNFAPVEQRNIGRKPSRESVGLILEIDLIRAERRISTTRACQFLSEYQGKSPWKGRDARSIEVSYYAHKKRFTAKPVQQLIYEAWRCLLAQNLGAAGDILVDAAEFMAAEYTNSRPASTTNTSRKGSSASRSGR
jgi:hypothetical protein